MSLLSLFEWLGQSPLGVAMRQSTWAFPIVETVHLLALAALGGCVLLIDLKLIGIGMRRQPVGRIARELSPLLAGSLLVMVLSGIVLVSAEAMKCYYHPAFRAKMVLLALAICFQSIVYRQALGDGSGAMTSRWSKAAGAISLTLWLSVGLAGRAIGIL